MSTLAEIESAADALPAAEKQELLLFLAARLRSAGWADLPPPRKFSREQIEEWIRDDEEGMEALSRGTVRIFLDASVLLAAAGSATGSSRGIFDYADAQGWLLLSSPWALGEVLRNLPCMAMNATGVWSRLRQQIIVVDDVVTIDRPVIFAASKDRPILFSALASADVLLTLDKADFADVLGGSFYGLRVRLPYDFLEEERAAGRLPAV